MHFLKQESTATHNAQGELH